MNQAYKDDPLYIKTLAYSKKNKLVKPTYIYVISNPAWGEYVKIGKANNVKDRLFSYNTSSPHRDYKCEYSIKVTNAYDIEQHFKKTYNTTHEWVKLSVSEAIQVIEQIAVIYQ